MGELLDFLVWLQREREAGRVSVSSVKVVGYHAFEYYRSQGKESQISEFGSIQMREPSIHDYFEVIKMALDSLRREIKNDTRLKILTYLISHERITWTTMQKEMDINSNMIRHHTNYLMKMSLLEKTKPGYKLTNAGKTLMLMTNDEIMQILKDQSSEAAEPLDGE